MKKERTHKKLFIHQTNHHGEGYFGIIGEKETFSPYSFEDCNTGDIATAVKILINIGFIQPSDVLLVEEMEVYDHLKEED